MWHGRAAAVVAMIALGASAWGHADALQGKDESVLGEMTMHVIPQAHIDLAWWWRYDPETLEVVVTHTLETAFGNMEKYPEYTFTYLQVPAIEPLETRHPDLFYKLRYYAHNAAAMGQRIPNPDASLPKGRLAIGSGLWCEVDGSVPSGESLVRQCLYGKRYFQKVFGIDVRTAWFQDAWTHPWTYPQILKKSGMDSYMFTRPRGEGEPMFWWEGPDGSRIFAYKPFEEGGESLAGREKMEARLLEMNERYGVKDDITLIGVGNHGGGAIRADVARMRVLMEQRATAEPPEEKPARFVFSTPAAFADAVLKDPHTFPVIKGELPGTIRGAYTTQSEVKKGNRVCENLLLTLEKYSALAARLGLRRYPRERLYEAWQKVMLNQFHDTISGTDILPSIEDALRRYAEIEAWGRNELAACLGSISARIKTDGPGRPVIVFNPLAWERSEVVESALEGCGAHDTVYVCDGAGKALPTQRVAAAPGDEAGLARFIFLAAAVPSLGYQVYWVRRETGRAGRDPSKEDAEFHLENEYFAVDVAAESGCVSRIFDKEHGREVLDGGGRGNLIQIFEDYGDSEGFLKSAEGKPEHNVWDGPSEDVNGPPQIVWRERGPVRFAIEVKHVYGLARFTQQIALSAGVRRIDFELAVDWEGTNKMVKVGFPFSVSPGEAAYEIPYGVIMRSSKGEESPAQNWIDLSESGYGVSFLNDGRYGYDVRGSLARLSVLRCPSGPVAATEEQGVHRLRYALYPHAGSWECAGVCRQGHAFNTPLIAVTAEKHGGQLPEKLGFMVVEPANIIASALKMAEDSEDLILRCYESSGISCAARIEYAAVVAPDAVHRTNLLEHSEAELSAGAEGFEATLGAFSIDSFKLIKD